MSDGEDAEDSEAHEAHEACKERNHFHFNSLCSLLFIW
jgi:hypothetical protein